MLQAYVLMELKNDPPKNPQGIMGKGWDGQKSPEQYQPHLFSASLSKQLLNRFFSTKGNGSYLIYDLLVLSLKPDDCSLLWAL